MKNYRLIEQDGAEIELTDGAIIKLHFAGRDTIIVTRKYEDGESIAKYSNFSETFYHDN